ncbi:nitrilase-related carbon-nitrogen hydrolase [Thiomicrorhabdus cannonii]|uniref:nitrilase-related carbon-nitrogen hydrolase n=1 Tax=Thiomicrorhabdus cannonii TaxID=2748011 RepID=UPI0015B8B282|nr:nitrilase-related carbon-nitrogen hydrolase [Thiomicrorhabdus cannonii]
MQILMMQFEPVWEDCEASLQRLEVELQQAMLANPETRVVVLPELFASGFSMQTGRIAQSRQGTVYAALQQWSERYGIYLIAGVALQGNGPKASNCALVFDSKGRELASYRKNRTFNVAGEGEHYEAGQQSVLFEIDGVSCSVFICYDLRFPELFRQVVPDAELVFVIANWPASRQLHWETLLRARAIENQCYVVGVNRIGTDGNGLRYAGGSMLIDPWGETVAYADATQRWQSAEIDPARVQAIRTQFPFLGDRR